VVGQFEIHTLRLWIASTTSATSRALFVVGVLLLAIEALDETKIKAGK